MDVQRAMSLLRRMEVPGPPEPLSILLARGEQTNGIIRATVHNQSKRRRETAGDLEGSTEPKWKQSHQRYIARKGLTQRDMQGMHDFMQAVGHTLLSRQREALWLKLVYLRKTKGLEWRSGLYVATVGASIGFMSVRQNMFPCVTPHMSYAILQNGELQMVTGIVVLALQGIQDNEVRAFKLHNEKASLLHDLGGERIHRQHIGRRLACGHVQHVNGASLSLIHREGGGP
jgi:hypothetical protein